MSNTGNFQGYRDNTRSYSGPPYRIRHYKSVRCWHAVCMHERHFNPRDIFNREEPKQTSFQAKRVVPTTAVSCTPLCNSDHCPNRTDSILGKMVNLQRPNIKLKRKAHLMRNCSALSQCQYIVRRSFRLCNTPQHKQTCGLCSHALVTYKHSYRDSKPQNRRLIRHPVSTTECNMYRDEQIHWALTLKRVASPHKIQAWE